MRKTFFYEKDGEALAQVAQKGGGSPSLETFKIRLGEVLSADGAVGVPVHCRALDEMAFKNPFHLKRFCDSMN